MSYSPESPRRAFLRSSAAMVAGFVASTPLAERLMAAEALAGREDPEVPNQEVARILKRVSGGRPIQRGHVSLDMPLVAEDGRVVPVIIETDLPMTPQK